MARRTRRAEIQRPSRKTRLLALLAVAAGLAAWYYLRGDDPPDWDRTLRVVVYPENVDGSKETERYIRNLSASRFDVIERYMAEQAAKYELPLEQPFKIELANPVSGTPRAPDYESFLSHIRWGLGVRFWYCWEFDEQGLKADIVVVTRYRANVQQFRLHSLGIPTINLAIVNLEAKDNSEGLNAFLIAHEILHTVGADDLYDRKTKVPVFPDGYVEPSRQPLYPQPAAELMAGRIPVARNHAVLINSLIQTEVGSTTARQIGWSNSR